MKELLPEWGEIPEKFRDQQNDNKWVKLVHDWFYYGLKDCRWTPKEGIDTKEAIRHVQAIMSSLEPKHEHKVAGCAFLLSNFFDNVQYQKAKS